MSSDTRHVPYVDTFLLLKNSSTFLSASHNMEIKQKNNQFVGLSSSFFNHNLADLILGQQSSKATHTHIVVIDHTAATTAAAVGAAKCVPMIDNGGSGIGTGSYEVIQRCLNNIFCIAIKLNLNQSMIDD